MNWHDLPFPWGVSALILAVGLWGTIASDNPAERAVSAITGIASLAITPLYYALKRRKRRIDARSTFGWGIQYNGANRPSTAIIDTWARWTIAELRPQLGGEKMAAALPSTDFIFVFGGKEWVSVDGRKSKGYYAHDHAAIAYDADLHQVEMAFKHELAHALYSGAGIALHKQHDLMKRTRLSGTVK